MALLMTTLAGAGNWTLASEAAPASDYVYTETVALYQDGNFPTTVAENSLATYSDSVETAIYNGFASEKAQIDVRDYNLSSTQMKEIVEKVLNTSPELFFVDNQYRYSINPITNRIAQIIPNYRATGKELAVQREEYTRYMKKITDQIDPSWSDLEKIVFTHDYLCQNYEYDTTYAIHDAYRFLKEKKGVCQSYTLVFLGVMKTFNIDARVASSSTMNHIWNVVQLNGKWYHVDVTWDDPTQDKLGLASHDNLLLSDTAIIAPYGSGGSKHTDWKCDYTCTDSTYDSYFWKSSQTPFQNLDDTWYYAYYDTASNDAKLCTYDFQTGLATPVHSIGRWNTPNGAYWAAAFTGLDIFDGKICYNAEAAVYGYDPVAKVASVIYAPTQSGNIYGMRIDENVLSYALSTTPTLTPTIFTHTLEQGGTQPSDTPTATPTPGPTGPTPGPTDPTPGPTDPTPSGSMKGDIDNNKTVNLTDAQLALKIALKLLPSDTVSAEVSDVNNDSKTDLTDAQLILKYALKIISSFDS